LIKHLVSFLCWLYFNCMFLNCEKIVFKCYYNYDFKWSWNSNKYVIYQSSSKPASLRSRKSNSTNYFLQTFHSTFFNFLF
jgi:hypothetical protein